MLSNMDFNLIMVNMFKKTEDGEFQQRTAICFNKNQVEILELKI